MSERSKLSALLVGIMNAVQKASSTAGQQNIHLLEHFFEPDPENPQVLVPIYTRIRIADGKVVDVPLITLLNPSGYQLQELKLDLSLRMKLDEIKQGVHKAADKAAISRGSYSVDLCPKRRDGNRRPTDVVDLSIAFKAADPAEGIMRIIEDLNNTVTPVDEDSAPHRGTMSYKVGSCRHDKTDIPHDEPPGTRPEDGLETQGYQFPDHPDDDQSALSPADG